MDSKNIYWFNRLPAYGTSSLPRVRIQLQKIVAMGFENMNEVLLKMDGLMPSQKHAFQFEPSQYPTK